MGDISNIVSVTVSLTPTGVTRTEFGRTLLLTTDTALHPTGSRKVRSFARNAALASYAFGDAVKNAAGVYFQADPRPRNLLIGRWVESAVDHELRGGAAEAVATIATVSDGSFSFAGESFTGADFASDASYADVAASLQTAMRANPAAWAANTAYHAGDRVRQSGSDFVANRDHTSTATADHVDGAPGATGATAWTAAADFSAVEVAAAGSALTVTMSRTLAVAGVFSTHPQGTGTDVSGMLGLDAASGADFVAGSAAETIAEALDEIVGHVSGSGPTFVVLDADRDGTDDILDLSDWGAANQVFAIVGSSESGALTANETASNAAQLFAKDPGHTIGVYSKRNDNKPIALAAYFSSINFDSPRSLRTGNLANLPGTVADALSASEEEELVRKNWNYTGFRGLLRDGRMVNGEWIDARLWAIWFGDALQTEVFNLIATRRVPQTPAGIQAIKETIAGVCEQGVTNGGIAPTGTVEADTRASIIQETGLAAFDGILANGYLIHVPPLASQTTAQRKSRVTPTFRVWAVGGGFVHQADISVAFQPFPGTAPIVVPDEDAEESDDEDEDEDES